MGAAVGKAQIDKYYKEEGEKARCRAAEARRGRRAL